MLSHRIPLYSVSWHTCSNVTRKNQVFATVYSTVHEHTETPVDTLALSAVKPCNGLNYVYVIAKLRPIQQSRTDEMRWDGLHENGLLWLDLRSFGTDIRPMTECVRTFNSTTLKMRALFKTTCTQAPRMVIEALWWNPKSKQSRQWWSMFSSLFFGMLDKQTFWGYEDYKSVIQVNKTQLSRCGRLWNALMFPWWMRINICFEQGLHLLGA